MLMVREHFDWTIRTVEYRVWLECYSVRRVDRKSPVVNYLRPIVSLVLFVEACIGVRTFFE
jgi:hypothetical protein